MASTLHDLPDSPCVGVCSTLFDDVRSGCGRTADEVSHWVFMNDDEKRAIWGAHPERVHGDAIPSRRTVNRQKRSSR